MKNNLPIVTFLMLFLSCNFYAQNKEITAYQPSKAEILERYKQALKLDDAVKNKVFKTRVNAHWQKDGNTFWYCNILKDSVREYILVDASKGLKKSLFDELKLKKALSEITGKTVPSKSLPIDSLNYDSKANLIALKYDKSYFEVSLSDYSIKKVSSLAKDLKKYPSLNNQWARWESFKTDSISPNKKWLGFIK